MLPSNVSLSNQIINRFWYTDKMRILKLKAIEKLKAERETENEKEKMEKKKKTEKLL